jgi:hypothetical protein
MTRSAVISNPDARPVKREFWQEMTRSPPPSAMHWHRCFAWRPVIVAWHRPDHLERRGGRNRHRRCVFSKGRDFASWLGLVPKQISTSDRTILGKISKRNRYLRSLGGANQIEERGAARSQALDRGS